jgi:hypothetical protein
VEGAVDGVQFAPESAETKTLPEAEPPAAATNLLPSADEATATQLRFGAEVGVQSTPASVDV